MTKQTIKVIKIKLTDKHLKNLALGKGILVSPNSMCEEGDGIYLGIKKHNRLVKNATKKKGTKLTLSADELKANGVEMDGGKINWKHIGRAIKSTAKVVAKVYRDHVRPVVGPTLKKVVQEGITDLASGAVEGALTLAGQPELAAIAAPQVRKIAKKYVADPLTETIRKTTGAYGVKVKKTNHKRSQKCQDTLGDEIHNFEYPTYAHPPYGLQSNWSNFIAPNHPAFFPTFPAYPDNSVILVGSGLYLTHHMPQPTYGGRMCGSGSTTGASQNKTSTSTGATRNNRTSTGTTTNTTTITVGKGMSSKSAMKLGRPENPSLIDLHDNSYM